MHFSEDESAFCDGYSLLLLPPSFLLVHIDAEKERPLSQVRSGKGKERERGTFPGTTAASCTWYLKGKGLFLISPEQTGEKTGKMEEAYCIISTSS